MSKKKKQALTVRNSVFWVILWCICFYVMNAMGAINETKETLPVIILALASFIGIPLAWLYDLAFIWGEEE